MRIANRTLIHVTLICLFSNGLAFGQDWPQWRGPKRDAKAAEFNAPSSWPKELSKKWDVPVGDGDATPALVADRLFVFARQGGQEVTLCLDATTGKELWQDNYETLGATGPSSRHSGPRSSPVWADGKVITYGVRGALSCLDAATGKVLWRKDDFAGNWPQFFTASSPLVADGMCIAQVGGSEKGGVVAYNLNTGETRWSWTRDGAAYASPVLLTLGNAKLLATLTDKNLVLLGLTDGTLFWESTFVPQRRAYNAATPIVDGQTVIYSGAGRGTRSIQISKQGSGFGAQETWANPDIAVQYNSPVLYDGRIYGLSQNGELFCLDAGQGQTLWTSPTGDRGGFGSIVSAGPVMMLLAPKGELVVFSPSNTEFKPIATYKVADSETYAYPVVAGRRIFVKDQDSVALWTVE